MGSKQKRGAPAFVCGIMWFLLPLLLAAQAACDEPNPALTHILIPPAIERRVLFYHSFENGFGQPDINLAHATILPQNASLGDGLFGRGMRIRRKGDTKLLPLTLKSDAFTPSRPLTISFWWRLDAEPDAATAFHLVALRGERGMVANFVRGQGIWCGLKTTAYVFQTYYYKGIGNVNQLGHRLVLDSGRWHHTVLTFSNADTVQVYWDGQRRTNCALRGRPFRDQDGGTLQFGASGSSHPITFDEILILDRALTGEEIRDYATALRKLRELRSPQTDAPTP